MAQNEFEQRPPAPTQAQQVPHSVAQPHSAGCARTHPRAQKVELQAEEVDAVLARLGWVHPEPLLLEHLADPLRAVPGGLLVEGHDAEVVDVRHDGPRAVLLQEHALLPVGDHLVRGEPGLLHGAKQHALAKCQRPGPSHRQNCETGASSCADGQRGPGNACLQKCSPTDGRHCKVGAEA